MNEVPLYVFSVQSQFRIKPMRVQKQWALNVLWCLILQGYLAHKKQTLPMTLQYAHAWGLVVVLGWWGARYPCTRTSHPHLPRQRGDSAAECAAVPRSQENVPL